MDDTQYDKRFTNRNKIIIPNGWTWITVPINKDCKFGPNSQVKINNNLAWKQTHWKRIYHSYSGAKFFHLYKEYLESLYKKDWRLLFDLNLETIKQTLRWLDIKIDIVKESELGISRQSTQRLVDICRKIGADTYVSGPGGKDYLDEKLFEKNNIKLEYQKYHSSPYPQHLTGSFVADLSIIDILANVGPNSLHLLSNQDMTILS